MVEIPKMRVSMVQEGTMRYKTERTINGPAELYKLVTEELIDSDREVVGVVNTNNKCKVLNWNTVSIGSADASLAIPREIFKTSILSNATGIFLVHCHPSGDTTPSEEDRNVTRRVAESGKILGIQLLDHIIVGCGSGYYRSLRTEEPELFE